MNSSLAIDMYTVYLQDRLLRQVLPRFGVPLLQLGTCLVEAGPGVAGPQQVHTHNGRD